jgi:Kef-type K+ transport system membrane component KefB
LEIGRSQVSHLSFRHGLITLATSPIKDQPGGFMPHNEMHSLLLIFTIAGVAPLLCEWVPRVRLPLVVLEIVLGILMGPQVLGWATPGPVIDVLARFGLAALFFLAGFEIDFPAIHGRPIILALLGWFASFLLCLGVGFGLQGCGIVDSGFIVGAALATTALGTLMPILRDARELSTRFGAYVVASGAVGEFAPIVMMALALQTGEGEHGGSLLLMLFFAGLTIVGAFIALKYRPPRLLVVMQQKMDTSAQLPIRLAILLLASLVILAKDLGLDSILGALAAGVLVALASPKEHAEAMHRKLDGIGFGFLVPIFFVTTGLHFDLNALTTSSLALLQLPMFLTLFFVVRGLPALLIARRELDLRSRIALGFLASTELPLVIAIAEIGVKSGQLIPETAASLVGAGMASVMLFPILGLSLRKKAATQPDVQPEPTAPVKVA